MASIIQIKATGSWRAQVRRKGFEKQTATFETREQAKRWAQDIEVKMARNEDPGANAQLTVAEVLRVYVENRSKPLSSSQLTCVRHLIAVLGKERVMRLLTSDLVSFCKYRIEVDGVKPASTRSDINTLSAAFKFYSGHTDVKLPNVIQASRSFLREQGVMATSPNRDRRPEESELKAMLKVLPKHYHDVLLFAIATAMRRSEIHRLKWSDLSERTRMIWVRQRKHPTEKERNDGLVPLLGAAWDIIKRQKRRPGDDRIFVFNPKHYSKAITAACKACGIANLRGHDMRHEGISRLFEAGLTIPEVQMISGHKTWAQLQRYTHLKPEALHQRKLPARRGTVVA